MEGDVSQMNTEELKDRIMQLEDSYAEILGQDADPMSLRLILMRIRELQNELKRRG